MLKKIMPHVKRGAVAFCVYSLASLFVGSVVNTGTSFGARIVYGIICGVIYPLIVWRIDKMAFGSIVKTKCN